MADWKKFLNPVLREYLNYLLKKVIEHSKAYSKAKKREIAQLWVANAILYRELETLKSEVKRLKERVENKKEDEENLKSTLKKYF